MNKKGSAYVWIYGLIFLGAGALIYIIFTQVINEHLYPVTSDLAVFNMSASELAQVDRYVGFWNYWPIILILLVILYWVYHSANKTFPEE